MPNIFVLEMGISVVIAVLIMVYTIVNHTVEKTLYLILFSVANLFFVFGNFLEIIAPSLEPAFYGVRIQYMGAPFLLPLIYLFYRDFNEERRLAWPRQILLFAIPVFSAVSLQLFPLVRLQYGEIWYSTNGQIASVQHTDGIAYLLGIALNYVCIVLSLLLILKSVLHHRGLKRRQSIVLLAGWILPVAANIFFIFFGGENSYDYTPIAYVTSTATLLYSALTQKLLNVLPLARAQVMDELEDAFIVCDENHRFLDANQSARRLFPELSDMMFGDSLEKVRGFQSQGELRLWRDGEEKCYKITANPILQGAADGGVCIVFRDVTTETRLLENLQRQAMMDALTGVYNRGTFFDLAGQTLMQSREQTRNSAVLMLDVDHFKRINDTYGHSCGDLVLKAVAQTAKEHFEKGGVVGRYGGEEFAVLLEDYPCRQAVEAAEKFREAIQDMTIACQGKDIRVTISIGVACCDADCKETLEELQTQADQAMYVSKARGRNQTSLYDEKQTAV